MSKNILAVVILSGAVVVIVGAYWWANVPPKRPDGMSANAVFLWAGHLGLPAPKHGTWIECWVDEANDVNKCRLYEMDGTPFYEGVFLADTGGAVSKSNLQIESEITSNRSNWVNLGGLRGAPFVFLKNGVVLIPKDGYQEGAAKLLHLHQLQGK